MRYLLVEEAADVARTSASTVRYWIATGRLRSTRPGRRRLIAEADLQRFLEQRPSAPEPREETA